MRRFTTLARTAVAAALFMTAPIVVAADSADSQSVDELRNTVINVLQALVDRGILTREQAEKIVQDAQARAAENTAAAAAQEKAEESAVRVPYVPEIVKDEIRRQVAEDLQQDVTRDVVETAQKEGWGVPAALPDWVRNMRWSGDVRVRGEGDFFASDNARNVYLDFQRINEAGGVSKAGLDALTNVSEDRNRLRYRLRFGFEGELDSGWTFGAALSTGNLSDPISPNQTLGVYGQRGQIGVDVAWVDWHGASLGGGHRIGFKGGRMRNPFLTAGDLVYDQDLSFDGVDLSYRYSFDKAASAEKALFVHAGGFPIEEIELSSHDKWLAGWQLGVDLRFTGGHRTRAGAAYYRFINIAGRRNELDSKLLDFTAPQVIRRGNTVFDIRNDNDTSTNLYALAADYDLVNVSLIQDWQLAPGKYLTLSGDAVRNIGYSESKVLARTGFAVPGKTDGYQVGLMFGSAPARTGSPNAPVLGVWTPHAWRAAVEYRYVERDAVLDAFTDSDFHLGGTDTRGFTFGLDYWFTSRVQARLEYSTGNEIDGPPLGVDVLQLDFTTSF